MKKGAMIIDISCDRAGGIETSIPITIGKFYLYY
jgi:alanine dehydrogenase